MVLTAGVVVRNKKAGAFCIIAKEPVIYYCEETFLHVRWDCNISITEGTKGAGLGGKEAGSWVPLSLSMG